MKRRVVLVTNIYYPTLVSTGYYITKIAERLIDSGEEVVVITSKINQEIDLKRKEHIIRVGLINEYKDNLLLRVFGMLVFWLSAIRKLRGIIRSDDKILILSNPPLLILTSFFIRSTPPPILLLHDFFPFNYFLIQQSRKLKLLNPLIKKIFRIAYSKYGKIIVVGRDMNDRLKSYINNCRNHKPIIKTIPNWSQTSEVLPNWQFSQNSHYNIVFAGNIGLYQSLEKFTEIFIRSKTKYNLKIYGNGLKRTNIHDIISRENKKNVHLLGEFKREDQSKILDSVDIGLITLKEGMYGLGVPSKLYNLLAAGKPILFIGDEGSEIYDLINSNNLGWAFSWNEKSAIQEFLEQELSLEDIVVKGKNGRELAEKNFDQNNILQKIQDFIIK